MSKQIYLIHFANLSKSPANHYYSKVVARDEDEATEKACALVCHEILGGEPLVGSYVQNSEYREALSAYAEKWDNLLNVLNFEFCIPLNEMESSTVYCGHFNK